MWVKIIQSEIRFRIKRNELYCEGANLNSHILQITTKRLGLVGGYFESSW